MNKKNIVVVWLFSFFMSAILDACTFTVLNDSNYDEIFISNDKNLAVSVSRDTLLGKIKDQNNDKALKKAKQEQKKRAKAAIKGAKKSERTGMAKMPFAVEIVQINKGLKKVKKQAPTGQITDAWFDIYTPHNGQYYKRMRVSIRYCGHDNYLPYTDIKSGFTKIKDLEQRKRMMDRFEIVNYKRPDEVCSASKLVVPHTQDMAQGAPAV